MGAVAYLILHLQRLIKVANAIILISICSIDIMGPLSRSNFDAQTVKDAPHKYGLIRF